ncbi:MAG TPA: hypothetical protein VLT59_17710 [Steroidobacteraceae bacterium]|nr:hypothetical protein [Steroidobacteraceae bacterium]
MASERAAPQRELPLSTKLKWLHRPECYPETAGRIESLETHFAWVFFTGQHAYKLKKPVHLRGMDYSSVPSRHWSCLEELRLNRRLAPAVYLEVVPLVRRDDGAMRLEPPGDIVDWLVKMVRLDSRQMLDTCLESGAIEPGRLRPALELLARFYRDAPRIDTTGSAFRRRLEAQVERNRSDLLDPLLGVAATDLREITHGQLEFLAQHHTLFAGRAVRHALLEGHGDLRPEHVYVGTPPCVIDCLEFDRDLRLCDPVEELAFLGLECGRAGAGWVSSAAIEIYAAVTADAPPPEVVDFYISHRAVTRAKIIAWHLADPTYRDRAPWSQMATGYLQLARDALDRAWSRQRPSLSNATGR